MAKRGREQTVEDRKNVVRYIMRNPTAPIREIAEKLSVPSASVQRYLKEYRESDNKDPRIISLTNKDLDIVRRGQEIIEEKLNDPEQVARMKASEVSAVTSESAKRYSLLRGVQENNQTVTNQAIQVNILFGDKQDGSQD